MPVAMETRRLEQPGSGLQYSYDDLDICACHRAPPAATCPWQGRRGRCASLPGHGLSPHPERCWFMLVGGQISCERGAPAGMAEWAPPREVDPAVSCRVNQAGTLNGFITEAGGRPHRSAQEEEGVSEGDTETPGDRSACRVSHSFQCDRTADPVYVLPPAGGATGSTETADDSDVPQSSKDPAGLRWAADPECSGYARMDANAGVEPGSTEPCDITGMLSSNGEELTKTSECCLRRTSHQKYSSTWELLQDMGAIGKDGGSPSGEQYRVTGDADLRVITMVTPSDALEDQTGRKWSKVTDSDPLTVEIHQEVTEDPGTPRECDGVETGAEMLCLQGADGPTMAKEQSPVAGELWEAPSQAQSPSGDESSWSAKPRSSSETTHSTGDHSKRSLGETTSWLGDQAKGAHVGGGEALCKYRTENTAMELRVRKVPKEEQPYMDSMALLILKLDQLDQDIRKVLDDACTEPAGQGRGHPVSRAPVRKGRAEAEAKEACAWLRAAGFPQYAQVYEDGQFPINTSSVTCDHDFLDRDAIEALCRRLNTLNKCTVLRLEIPSQRKQSEDSDDDEPCAISGRWTFQRASKRWSRLEEPDVFEPSGERSRGSAESLLTDPGWPPRGGPHSPIPASSGTTRAGSLASVCSSGTSAATEDSPSEGPPSPSPSPPSPGDFLFDAPSRSMTKSARSKARSLLRRMENLGLRGPASRRRKKPSTGAGGLEISAPVLRQGPDEDWLRRLHCVDVSVLRERAASGSEPSGGSSAVSTPSPVSRSRSHSAAKRAGVYLEGFDLFSFLEPQAGGVAEHNQRNCIEMACEDEEDEEDAMFFFVPDGHKPGTFPKMLCNGRRSSGSNVSRGPAHSHGSLDSRLSFYDNVPLAEEESLAYKLSNVLRGFGEAWVGRGGRASEEGDSDSALDSASPCPSSPLQSHLEEAENGSDLDNALNDPDAGLGQQERRDSGVGPSLLRTNRPPKLRWPSFQDSHRASLPSAPRQLSTQSVLQMNLLQKFSLLKLTALLEKHTPANKHAFSWAVPKFMKRSRTREQRGHGVFGVPLQTNVCRTGQPLPLGIQQAMRFLRSQCLDQVGLFRKSGVKSRIQALREMNEVSPDGVNYEGQSAYDVADMLKQYFRDLPEPLLTSKLSETFLQIYQCVPREQQLQAARAATLLLPDENRQALEALLCFLSDVAAAAPQNQMTCTNLAVCLAPSLFHLSASRRDSSSPRVMHRKQNLGKPDQRDLKENQAATRGLAHMISECRRLFQIPEEKGFWWDSYKEQGLPPAGLDDLEESAEGLYLRDALDNLLREAKDKFRGYDSCFTPEQQVALAYKKVQDDFPLRLWKASTEVLATPEEVLTRLLRERHLWDEDLLESRVLEVLDSRTELYQYVQDSMAPRPPRDHVVLRTWVTDLPRGACALACASVDHPGVALRGVRANVLVSRYFMEPCGSGQTRLTYLSRMDCRGHFPEWYNKVFGHRCASKVAHIRDSFTGALNK
ncbi:rho GTPase-activating protein 7 isoform X1 [Paramormyrops kingsleyae]